MNTSTHNLAIFFLCIIHATRVLSFSLNQPQARSNVALPIINPSMGIINRVPSLLSLSSGVTQNSDSTKSETSSTNATADSTRISISRPKIHWTVPGFKFGWQDDNGDWFDEDGARNGPPLNYWRQKSDEREYHGDMGALETVMAEFDIEETVTNLEKRRSVRYPSLSRKALGRWVPILLSGERVTFNDEPADSNGDIQAPFVLEIYRTNGRLYGPKNFYGIFDKKISSGEELTFTVLGKDESIVSSTNTIADNNNEPIVLTKVLDDKPLQYGGITYITDYIMIQRSEGGGIDFWLRADESYLGVFDSNVGMGEVKVEQ